jgi:DnaJ-class molecular chaperone
MTTWPQLHPQAPTRTAGGTAAETCWACHGSGVVKMRCTGQPDIEWVFVCERCLGCGTPRSTYQ